MKFKKTYLEYKFVLACHKKVLVKSIHTGNTLPKGIGTGIGNTF